MYFITPCFFSSKLNKEKIFNYQTYYQIFFWIIRDYFDNNYQICPYLFLDFLLSSLLLPGMDGFNGWLEKIDIIFEVFSFGSQLFLL